MAYFVFFVILNVEKTKAEIDLLLVESSGQISAFLFIYGKLIMGGNGILLIYFSYKIGIHFRLSFDRR